MSALRRSQPRGKRTAVASAFVTLLLASVAEAAVPIPEHLINLSSRTVTQGDPVVVTAPPCAKPLNVLIDGNLSPGN